MTVLTALWIRDRYGRGRFVREISRPDADPTLPLTPYEARRLAADLTAAADEVDPRPRAQRGGQPYGWRYVTRGEAEPDLAEMDTIDLIVQHSLDGLSRTESVATLNALGRRRRDGKPWTRDTLRQVTLRLLRDGVLVEPRTQPAQQQLEP